jgi:hypothetical protein
MEKWNLNFIEVDYILSKTIKGTLPILGLCLFIVKADSINDDLKFNSFLT